MFQIEFDSPSDRVVGIDLGTTNSLIAWINLGRPEVIEGEDGAKLVPSVVSLAARRRDHRRKCRAYGTDRLSRPQHLFREAPDGSRRGRRSG